MSSARGSFSPMKSGSPMMRSSSPMTRSANRAAGAAGHPANDVPPFVDLLALTVAGFTIYTFLEISLIPVHAGCMTLAFLYLLPQGVLTAARPSRERSMSTVTHIALQVSALLLSLAGFLAIFLHHHHHARHTPHFHSTHSRLGLATLVLAQVVGLGGAMAYFGPLLVSRKLLLNFLFAHKLAGRAVVILGCLTVLSSLHFLDWFHPMFKGWKSYVIGSSVVALAIGLSPLLLSLPPFLPPPSSPSPVPSTSLQSPASSPLPPSSHPYLSPVAKPQHATHRKNALQS